MPDGNTPAQDYFDLIEACATKVIAEKSAAQSWEVFWTGRIRRAWQTANEVLSIETTPVDPSRPIPESAEYVSALGQLAREALMAAAYYGAVGAADIDEASELHGFLVGELREM